MKFAKPPIVELIAEFRWLPVTADGTEVTDLTAMMFNGPEAETFYNQFGAILAVAGFGKSERLIPPTFPSPIYNPLIRFSRPLELNPTAIIQVGPGILSVHALPPYEDWHSFRPMILQALGALLDCRKPSSRSRVFTRVMLRYIDLFGPELTGGRSVAEFVREVLGVSVSFPSVMVDEAPDVNSAGFSLTVKTRTRTNMDLAFVCAPHPGQPDGATVLMDTSIASSAQIPWDADSPMDALDTAHGSIRSLFLGLTESINQAMQPVDLGTKHD